MKLDAPVGKAVNQLAFMKNQEPLKYAGRWYLAKIDSVVYAFRNIETLKKRGGLAGLTEMNIATNGPCKPVTSKISTRCIHLG